MKGYGICQPFADPDKSPILLILDQEISQILQIMDKKYISPILYHNSGKRYISKYIYGNACPATDHGTAKQKDAPQAAEVSLDADVCWGS